MSESHVRIDDGIKRGPRKRIKPSDMEREARDQAGRFLTTYTPEARANAVNNALLALECGGRVEEIADKHGVPRSTLYSWLIGDERAKALRTQFFDGQMGRHLAAIEGAETPLELARAREALSGWLKVAERRDHANYGPKQEVTHNINGDLGDKLRRARDRQVIDVTPQQLQRSTEITVVTATPDQTDNP